jgi:hypothetical protein
MGFIMFNALSQFFAVLRSSISAHNALHQMSYSQVQDIDALKAAFLADLTTQIDAMDAKSETPANATLVGA